MFAAASLKNALDEAAAAWTKATGKTARISYAGSNALAKQIESGAPADLFISADRAWMDYVERAGLLKPGSRIDFLRNALVLIAPGPKNANGDPQVALAPNLGTTLAQMLGGGKLAMATIDAVPAGKYGKAALEKLGAWDGGEGAGRTGRERARRPAARGPRRGAARHRLRDRRGCRSERPCAWRPSRRTATRRSSIRRR